MPVSVSVTPLIHIRSSGRMSCDGLMSTFPVAPPTVMLEVWKHAPLAMLVKSWSSLFSFASLHGVVVRSVSELNINAPKQTHEVKFFDGKLSTFV